MAAKEGRDDLVELLVSFQADINGSDANGETALHSTSKKGNKDMVKLLLKLGADPGATDKVCCKLQFDCSHIHMLNDDVVLLFAFHLV